MGPRECVFRQTFSISLSGVAIAIGLEEDRIAESGHVEKMAVNYLGVGIRLSDVLIVHEEI